jgi:hypothetical protein
VVKVISLLVFLPGQLIRYSSVPDHPLGEDSDAREV